MADKPKRRSPWPRPTLHTIFFAVGCTCGRLEWIGQHFEDEPALMGGELVERINVIREQIEPASFWPLMRELGLLCESVGRHMSGDAPMSDAV